MDRKDVFTFIVEGVVTSASSHEPTHHRAHRLAGSNHTIECEVMDGSEASTEEMHGRYYKHTYPENAQVRIICRIRLKVRAFDAALRIGRAALGKRPLRSIIDALSPDDIDALLAVVRDAAAYDAMVSALLTEYPEFEKYEGNLRNRNMVLNYLSE